MNQFTEIITPIALAIVSALASVAIYAIGKGKDAAIAWLKSHATEKQQVVISQIAQEAHAYAEKWTEQYGAGKMETALGYVEKELAERGINISSEQMRGAVQNAWLKYNQTKPNK